MSISETNAATTHKPKKFSSPTLLTGLFLLVLSLGVVVTQADNFLAIGMAFFVLMIGIALVMMGALVNTEQTSAKKNEQQSIQKEITREIVKVRCSHCSALNYETANRCTNCGAVL